MQPVGAITGLTLTATLGTGDRTLSAALTAAITAAVTTAVVRGRLSEEPEQPAG